MLDQARNFSKVQVSTGYDASALSVVLNAGHGAKLPTAPFNAVWWNNTDYADPSEDPNVEIVRVTLVSTDTLTITRAQEGTAASTKNTAGKIYKMIAGLTAKVINTDLKTYFDTLYFGNPMTQAGDIIKGGAAGVAERLPIGTANQVLHGGTSVPAYSAVVEADITLANNTTNNSTTVKHGFLPQLPGTTNVFLRGDGAFAAPGAVTLPNAYVEEAFAYIADTVHNIVHNFGTYPLVQCFSSTGLMVVPVSIQQIDDNTTALVFSKTETYTVVLTLGSPPLSTITTVSADYSVLANDYLIKETGAGKFITLPTAVGRDGKIFIVKNSSSGVCDVICTGAETMDGNTDVTIAAGDAYSFMSDGANYIIF